MLPAAILVQAVGALYEELPAVLLIAAATAIARRADVTMPPTPKRTLAAGVLAGLAVFANVKAGSTLYSDGFPVYRNMGIYNHAWVDHKHEEYVRGAVHTQTIEGFWSLMKRGIGGVYHQVSHKWLQSYVDEYCFHYNTREGLDPFRVLLARASLATT